MGVRVGDRVGATVGLCVGSRVGRSVGTRVGALEGRKLGTAVVGVFVGDKVGTCVGSCVGAWVARVGALVPTSSLKMTASFAFNSGDNGFPAAASASSWTPRLAPGFPAALAALAPAPAPALAPDQSPHPPHAHHSTCESAHASVTLQPVGLPSPAPSRDRTRLQGHRTLFLCLYRYRNEGI